MSLMYKLINFAVFENEMWGCDRHRGGPVFWDRLAALVRWIGVMVTTISLDIAKHVFQVYGVDTEGRAVS
jgi:hypothetical protein